MTCNFSQCMPHQRVECRATYSKCAQLASAALRPDGQDLRDLAGHAQNAGCAHRQAEVRLIDQVLVEQEPPSTSQSSNPRRNRRLLATVVQHQGRDRNVLDQDERRLAVRAERESIADVVAQRDEVGAGFEEV